MSDQDRALVNDGSVNYLNSVKGDIRNHVKSEVVRQSKDLDEHEQQQAAELGAHLKRQAIADVARSENEVHRSKAAVRIIQFVNFAFYLVYWFIGLEILLELFGARESNGFRRFIHAVSGPFLYPFRQLFPDPSAGSFHFHFSYIAALVIYLLLHWTIKRVIRLVMMPHPSTVA